jgi:hypothetical protein
MSKMVPKYGVSAATQSVVGNIWLAPAFLGFIAIPLLEDGGAGVAQQTIGYMLVAIAAICVGFALFRSITSIRNGRRYKRGQANTGA